VWQRKIAAKDMQMIQLSLASSQSYSAARSKLRSTKRNKCSFLALLIRNVIEQTGQLFRMVNIASQLLNL